MIAISVTLVLSQDVEATARVLLRRPVVVLVATASVTVVFSCLRPLPLPLLFAVGVTASSVAVVEVVVSVW